MARNGKRTHYILHHPKTVSELPVGFTTNFVSRPVSSIVQRMKKTPI